MVVVVPLHGVVVDHGVAFDVGRVGAILHNHGRSVQIDTVVDHQQRVVVVDNVVVHTDTIQVLLEQVLEEQVLLLESGLLLLDCQFIKVDLVITLVKVVKLLEFVVGVWVYAENLLDLLLRFLLSIRV